MEESSIITYDRIYDILRLEKYKKEIQKLDRDFNQKVASYINEKEAILENQKSKDSIFAEQSITKTRRQLDNAKGILKELHERREAKIVQLALFNSRTGQKLQEAENLVEEEYKLYIELVTLFNIYRENTLHKLIMGSISHFERPGSAVNQNINEKYVKFLTSVPEFSGEDMKTYGPYDTNDKAVLPVKVSEVLIKNKVAEEV